MKASIVKGIAIAAAVSLGALAFTGPVKAGHRNDVPAIIAGIAIGAIIASQAAKRHRYERHDPYAYTYAPGRYDPYYYEEPPRYRKHRKHRKHYRKRHDYSGYRAAPYPYGHLDPRHKARDTEGLDP